MHYARRASLFAVSSLALFAHARPALAQTVHGAVEALPTDHTLREVALQFVWRFVTSVIAIGAAVLLTRALPRFERWIVKLATKNDKAGAGSATASVIDQTQRIETLARVTLSIGRAAIWVTTIIAVLGMVGINVGPLLAGVSIAGVAVGFGAQSIVKDFFSGFFVLLEDQFDVGDTITIGAVTGVVERMTLRMTMLRDPSGTAYFFPNSEIKNVANKTYGWARCSVDVQFASSVPVSVARAAMNDAALRVNDNGELGDKVQDEASAEGPVELSPIGALTMRVGVKAHAIHTKLVRKELIESITEALRARGFTATDKGFSLTPSTTEAPASAPKAPAPREPAPRAAENPEEA